MGSEIHTSCMQKWTRNIFLLCRNGIRNAHTLSAEMDQKYIPLYVETNTSPLCGNEQKKCIPSSEASRICSLYAKVDAKKQLEMHFVDWWNGLKCIHCTCVQKQTLNAFLVWRNREIPFFTCRNGSEMNSLYLETERDPERMLLCTNREKCTPFVHKCNVDMQKDLKCILWMQKQIQKTFLYT